MRTPTEFTVLDSQFARLVTGDTETVLVCDYPSCPHEQGNFDGWTLVSELEWWNDHVRRYHK